MQRPSLAGYLAHLGVERIEARTCPFDPGYDPATLESHLEQSSHLMAELKISMACWIIADEGATRRKFAAARERGIETITGGGPFEIAAAHGVLPAYLELCADVGASCVECGEGFTDLEVSAKEVIRMASEFGLAVEVELGGKHTGAFRPETVEELVREGERWLDEGARGLVIEARESARGVGLFDVDGNFAQDYAERFVEAFGFERLFFEAPTKASQFALMDHFGPAVRLSNVRLEELLRVEIYRRGLHSDAFDKPALAIPSRAREAT
jgi:phosphosulfolactate synthase